MSCSSEKRKYVLSESINLTCSEGERKELFLKLNETINNNSTLVDSPSHDAKDLVSYIPDIGIDDDLIARLCKEAESLDLKTRSASTKVKNQWISNHSLSYQYGHEKHDAKPLSEFTATSELMALCNAQESTTQNANVCLLSAYNSPKCILRPHADDEEYMIDQDSSICTFSVGATRTLQFSKKPKKHKTKGKGKKVTLKPVFSIKMLHKSLTVMKPGCQQKLLHEVLPGDPSEDNQVRYSWSFRYSPIAAASQHLSPDKEAPLNGTAVVLDIPSPDSPISHQSDTVVSSSSPLSSNTDVIGATPPAGLISTEALTTALPMSPIRSPPPVMHSPQPISVEVSASSLSIKKSTSQPPPRKTTLIAGDSYSARLDPIRLGKKNKNIINISKGGSTIDDVEKSIDNYYISQSNVLIEKVFVCVGTNDLNKCYENGVLHLKSPLKQLCKKIKLLFPDAKVYFQPVLPMPVKNKYTVYTIKRFNKLLYDTCIRERFYFIDIFWDFVGYDGLRYKEY